MWKVRPWHHQQAHGGDGLIHLRHRRQHKPREMPLRNPIRRIRRHQKRLLTTTRNEVLRHKRIVLNPPDRPPLCATPTTNCGRLARVAAPPVLGVSESGPCRRRGGGCATAFTRGCCAKGASVAGVRMVRPRVLAIMFRPRPVVVDCLAAWRPRGAFSGALCCCLVAVELH
jgi:hypothetical protein